MARYYFHVVDGSFIADDTGSEFADIDAAKAAAVSLAGSILREAKLPGIWSGETWKLHVTDSPVIGAGHTFCTLKFSGIDGGTGDSTGLEALTAVLASIPEK